MCREAEQCCRGWLIFLIEIFSTFFEVNMLIYAAPYNDIRHYCTPSPLHHASQYLICVYCNFLLLLLIHLSSKWFDNFLWIQLCFILTLFIFIWQPFPLLGWILHRYQSTAQYNIFPVHWREGFPLHRTSIFAGVNWVAYPRIAFLNLFTFLWSI